MAAVTAARWVLLAVLLSGGALRLVNAARAPLELIERDEFIPAALTLSIDHHPIRVAQHGAVPMYLIRASGLLFGETTFGFRVVSVIASTLTGLLLYLIAARWWSPWAGVVGAALLSVERYHYTVSARAIDLPFDLLFISVAMWCYSRFLHAAVGSASRATAGRWLYGAGAAIGLGFLCKELTALMIPILLLATLFTGQAQWLRRREPWLAAGLFLLIIAPDLHSNLTTTAAERQALFERHHEMVRRLGGELTHSAYLENGLYMSYADHLSRFRSIGFNKEPFYFYVGDMFDWSGMQHSNEFAEFPYMHPLMGVALWIVVAIAVWRRPKDRVTVFLLTMFFGMFLPFALVQMGNARAALPTGAEVLWYWVDRTMLPAMLLAGGLAAPRRETSE